MVITDPNADPAKKEQENYVFEDPLTGDCTADELKAMLIHTYYRHVRHTDISVSKAYYRTNDTLIDDAEDDWPEGIATAKYEISLTRRIDGPSFEVA